MVDCLEYAVKKENEIPRLIEIIFYKLNGKNNEFIQSFNKEMRPAEEIMKDYGLEVR